MSVPPSLKKALEQRRPARDRQRPRRLRGVPPRRHRAAARRQEAGRLRHARRQPHGRAGRRAALRRAGSSGAHAARPGTACPMTASARRRDRRAPPVGADSLSALRKDPHRALILTTANAHAAEDAAGGRPRRRDRSSPPPAAGSPWSDIVRALQRGGFERVATVRERGEFAVRGGILDLFAPGEEEPVRLDFFGDTLETIRAFDPASQRTTTQLKTLRAGAGLGGQARRGDDQPLPHATTSSASARRSAPTRSMPRSPRASASPAWSTGCRCSTSSWTRCSTIATGSRSSSTI